MKTVVHVNQHNIKANAKGAELPVITVKDYKKNRKTNNKKKVPEIGYVQEKEGFKNLSLCLCLTTSFDRKPISELRTT